MLFLILEAKRFFAIDRNPNSTKQISTAVAEDEEEDGGYGGVGKRAKKGSIQLLTRENP